MEGDYHGDATWQIIEKMASALGIDLSDENAPLVPWSPDRGEGQQSRASYSRAANTSLLVRVPSKVCVPRMIKSRREPARVAIRWNRSFH